MRAWWDPGPHLLALSSILTRRFIRANCHWGKVEWPLGPNKNGHWGRVFHLRPMVLVSVRECN